jgi:hypothetical protein
MNIYITKDDGFISQDGEAGTSGCNFSDLPENLSSLSWDDSTNTGMVELDHGVVQNKLVSETDIKTQLGMSLADILEKKTDRDAEIEAAKKYE